MENKTDNIPGLVGYHITRNGTLYSRFDKSGHLTPRIGYPRNGKPGIYYPLVWTKVKYHGNKRGYLFTQKNGKCYYAHRLVALAYIPNPENKEEVDHINNVVTDNRVENLRWVTPQENMRHVFESGNHRGQKISKEEAEQIAIKFSKGVSITKTCIEYNIGRTTARKAAYRQRKFQNYD